MRPLEIVAPDHLIREIRAMGVNDPRVLDAIRLVPRPCFLPTAGRRFSWHNAPASIGEGQTISQPYTVAAMVELANIADGASVLEIGAGSGYAAAVMAVVAGPRGRVVAVEIRPSLADAARENLSRAQEIVSTQSPLAQRWDDVAAPIDIVDGDGKIGHPASAPYSAVLCSAQTPVVPPALYEQLRDGGVLVAPVESGGTATMTRYTRAGSAIHETRHGLYSFVPLV